MNNIFINPSLTAAFLNYKKMKDNKDINLMSDFLTYVISVLCHIYGEENVLNLFDKNDKKSFNYLLKKYDLDSYYIDKFYDDILQFSLYNDQSIVLNEKNPFFIYIQEDLINMFIAKYHVTKFDPKYFDKFKSMLFTLDNESEFVREFTKKYVYDVNYIAHYYDSKVGLLLSNLIYHLKEIM